MSPIIQKTRRMALLTATVLLMSAMFAMGASAAERETLYNAEYCFSPNDFTADGAVLSGIFVTDVPEASVGKLCYGSRVIQPGDVLPAAVLQELTLSPSCRGDAEAAVGYLPITPDGLGQAQTLRVAIDSGRNEAPTAEDGQLETYKNVANNGRLTATDPEGDDLRFHLLTAPKRGSVELAADGTYTYTPAKNKVGRDEFTYSVTDAAGNVSAEATVEIEIHKPMDDVTYGDMAGDSDQFEAMWLWDNGIFAGESVAGVTCFSPDKAVTRGEFLVMVAKLTGLEPDDAQLTSGFADESTTPSWMRPYIVSALRAGIITGRSTQGSLVFAPDDPVTAAEAAVMLQNILRLPDVREASAVLEGEQTVPAWAADAVAAMADAGLPMPESSGMVTRREAARMLYASSQLLEEA